MLAQLKDKNSTSIDTHFSSVLKLFLAVSLSSLFLFKAVTAIAETENPIIEMKTDLGDITIVLFADKAPVTVENFLTYVKDGFFDGTIFHRIIPGFVVQGGGHTFDFTEKITRDPIINEAKNGLLNTPGTLSMARTYDPNSATSQFFINLNHNTTLDYSENNPGYAVFGQIINGMDVVYQMVEAPRGRYRKYPEAPNEMIRIIKVTQIDLSTKESNR
ncbi:MAG: peptidylprolyl isomerase [Cellvibrionaceae bacterium]